MKNDSWGPALSVAVGLFIIGFSIGLAVGIDKGTDRACKQMCSTTYAWWEDDHCVCANELETVP